LVAWHGGAGLRPDNELYKDKPSTPPVESCIIETVYIPKEEYDGDTIAVAQPIQQQQEATTIPVRVSEEYTGDTIAVSQKPVQVHQLLSPSPTPIPTSTLGGQDQSPSPDPVESLLLQESSALIDPLHRTPGG
jgi:hypothetical protein